MTPGTQQRERGNGVFSAGCKKTTHLCSNSASPKRAFHTTSKAAVYKTESYTATRATTTGGYTKRQHKNSRRHRPCAAGDEEEEKEEGY